MIPTPYWVSYPVMVELAGGTPVCGGGPRRDSRWPPRTSRRSWDPRRDSWCSANLEPTGVATPLKGARPGSAGGRARRDLDRLRRYLPQLVYDDYEHASAFRALEGVTDRIVVVDGISKSYAMTGYRIGVLAAPRR